MWERDTPHAPREQVAQPLPGWTLRVFSTPSPNAQWGLAVIGPGVSVVLSPRWWSEAEAKARALYVMWAFANF